MPEQIQKPEIILPEGLEASRVVGQIPSSELPWMEGSERSSIAVSELTFSDGTAYLASAVPPSLEKITEIARSQDPRPTAEDPYTRLDKLLILGCHLEASGQSGSSGKINLLKGDLSPEFADFSVRSLHESNRPNTRRIYYAFTDAKAAGVTPVKGVELNPEFPLLIRLVASDKSNQVNALKRLTTRSVRMLRDRGAGR